MKKYEYEFMEKLKESIEKMLVNKYNKYIIEANKNLLYKVIVNETLKYKPHDPKNPKRGQYAFQTDLLISKKENNLPLVALEIKYSDFDSHDVLIYSTKALKHKEIYPYLRYGFVIGGKDKVDNKFFRHNTGFDFAIAVKEANEIYLRNFFNIAQKQIDSAELLLNIFNKKTKIIVFNSTIDIIKPKKA